MDGINNFFKEIINKPKEDFDVSKWQDICFICASEFGWTQEDLLEHTSIPYLFDVMKSRERKIKKEEEDMRKLKKR